MDYTLTNIIFRMHHGHSNFVQIHRVQQLLLIYTAEGQSLKNGTQELDYMAISSVTLLLEVLSKQIH